jgi:formylglycine-generating enzyme required for sulfatase activity
VNSTVPPKPITNSIGMKLVLIPAGEFLMGSASSDKEAEDDEKPQHRVRITLPFYLGATEVTQGQFRAVTGQSPSEFKGSDDLRVEWVSWHDAVAFCDRLNELEKGQLGR